MSRSVPQLQCDLSPLLADDRDRALQLSRDHADRHNQVGVVGNHHSRLERTPTGRLSSGRHAVLARKRQEWILTSGKVANASRWTCCLPGARGSSLPEALRVSRRPVRGGKPAARRWHRATPGPLH